MISAPVFRAGDTGKMPASAPAAGKRTRILALDYGRKRIGVAVSDELGITAQPLLTLVRKNRRDDTSRLRAICRNHQVARILVGHPLHISGQAGEMALEAARFAERIQKELGIVVELADERLTSWEAQQLMAESNSTSRRKRGTVHLDDVAAAILLRGYLDLHRDRLKSLPGVEE